MKKFLVFLLVFNLVININLGWGCVSFDNLIEARAETKVYKLCCC